MFWKKKRKDDEPLFIYEGDSPRESARVNPPLPLKIDFGGVPGRLVDISAGGLAFNAKGLEVGEIRLASLKLPGEEIPISARSKVLSVSGENLCQCRFLDLAETMENAIHHYVLKVQKEELRQKKMRAP